MPLDPPFPTLEEIMHRIGEAGRRLAEIGALEGAAGNITAYIGWPIEPRHIFPVVEPLALPAAAPALAGGALVVTGSGCRLREVLERPTDNLGFVQIDADGRGARLFSAPNRRFGRLTSELNSHLAAHDAQVAASGTNYHALVHAQPLNLTYLSHIARYRDVRELNARLLRWQPETIINLPEGIGCLPFIIPGSADLMAATAGALRRHRVVVWGKHGVVARSDTSVQRAADLIEYVETAARYEYLNLAAGEPAEGLSADELRAICRSVGVEPSLP